MMRKLVPIAMALIGAGWPGCSCEHNGGVAGDGGLDMAVNPDAISGGDLVIMPKDVMLDLQAGGAPPSQAYTATALSGADVTAMTTFTVDDASLGGFNGATFTASGAHGGTTYVRADLQGTDRLRHAARQAARAVGEAARGCPPFPGAGTPACTATAQTPVVLYPPDGVLVPPNMNVHAAAVRSRARATPLRDRLGERRHRRARLDPVQRRSPTPRATRPTAASTICRQTVWDYIAAVQPRRRSARHHRARHRR